MTADLKDVLALAERLVVPKPSQEARLERTAAKVLEKTKAAGAAFHQVTGVVLGGSFAKKTWLPESADIDVFVKISEDTPGSEFESIGLRVGREAARGYKHGKKFAQHPYTEAEVDGVTVNIVPCYDVQMGAWKSAADRSLYHVEFVNRNLDERKRLQVRLVKRFIQAVGLYGAEIEREGFSGYAVEVLVYRYGDFGGVLRYFADLGHASAAPGGRSEGGEGEDEEEKKDGNNNSTNGGNGGKKRKDERENKKLLSLRDPIDEARELATAISNESVARMVLASRMFLARPDARLFKRGGVRGKVRKPLRDRVYVVRFDHRPLSEDTLWGELKKSTRQVVKHVEKHGFSIARAIAASDDVGRSAIILLPETDVLSEMEERVGPGVELAAEVKRFISMNRDRIELAWVGDDGRMHLLQRRKYTELARLLERLIEGEIAQIGASREVSAGIRKTGTLIRTAGKLNRAADEEDWLEKGIDEIVSDTIGTDSGR